MTKFEIVFEESAFEDTAKRQRIEMSEFKNKIKKMFQELKVPGKKYVKTIYISFFGNPIGTAQAYLKTGAISIGKYNVYGEAFSYSTLKSYLKHEIGHLYLHHHPELREEHEKFALRFQRTKWRT